MSDLIVEKVVIVGLGHIGLPLALALSGSCENIVGFDINRERVRALQDGRDLTQESSSDEIRNSGLEFSFDPDCLLGADFIIVTVPTPITKSKRPDLSPLDKACRTIGKRLSRGALVIFESTVYPTATEEFCGPILAETSGLEVGVDFKLAYSPNRINPGDRHHPLTEIVKVVSAQDEETLDKVADLYGRIIKAGVHRAPSIAVAEAAKVLENTQRDLNIALMNELAIICERLGMRTIDVIDAAATKWNFLRFTPGLVGGHCIGVDPYYLTAKAEEIGYHPDVILAGRRINDYMPQYVAQRILQLLAMSDQPIRNARIGILGLTFKENVADLRNSKVLDVVKELNAYGITPVVHDPMIDDEAVLSELDCEFGFDAFKSLHCLVLAIPHAAYSELTLDDYGAMLNEGGIFVDIKSQFSGHDIRPDITYWSL